MKDINENILFKSERYNYKMPIIVISLLMLILLFFIIKINFEFISNYKTRSIKLKESIYNEYTQRNEQETQVYDQFRDKLNIDSATLKTIHDSQINKAKKGVNKRKGDNILLLVFFDMILFAMLFFLGWRIYNYLYKNAENFLVTEKSIIINKFRNKEIIPFDSIESITMIGKVNLIEYFSNRDVNAILIKIHNTDVNKYIIANKYTYSNLSSLVKLLKNKIPEKLKIKKVEENLKRKSNVLVLGILFGFYIMIKEGFDIYGILFGLIIIISAVLGFGKEKKNPCPELFE